MELQGDRVTSRTCTRRTALKLGATGLFALASPTRLGAFAQGDAESFDIVKANAEGRIRFPRMVQEYYVEKLRAIEARANARRMALSSKTDAEAYIRAIREKIQRCFGPWPDKTPLNPRVTGSFERESYRVENVIFESRPGFLVTANLYLPKGATAPRPGVVGTCGHTRNGKAGYQEFAQGLVRQGYVVLVYDPIGQGERLQYVGENLDSTIGVGVREHLYAGNRQFLVGEFFGSWRAWDGIRALDYLLTRDEVDPNQIGVTGNSGGGTMTTWLCGVEQRWTMAAPSCFVTTFRRNLENEEPQDTEQCPPMALALELDHADFLLASAPDPIIILAKEKDFFDVRGSRETYDQMRHVYRLLGVEDRIGFFAGEGYHGYTQDNREAMYRWFNGVTGISDRRDEPPIELENDATLYCTPKGQVSTLGSKTVDDFTRETAERLATERGDLPGDALNQAVRSVLRLPDALPVEPPEFRVLQGLDHRSYPREGFARYAIETEPGIHAVVYRIAEDDLSSPPPHDESNALLYVAHISSDYELRREPFIRKLLEDNSDAILYTCDVRGIGESRPDVTGTDAFLSAYGSDYMHAIHAIMLDAPYTGRKTLDVLRVLQWLRAHGHASIHLAGSGWGAIPAAFTGLLDDSVTRVTLKAAPKSYKDIATAPRYDWPLSTLLPHVLRHFDLPDCYRALEPKSLRIVDSQDH